MVVDAVGLAVCGHQNVSRLQVDWSYPNSIGLSVALLPKKGSAEKPQVFNMELKKSGNRWLVDSWVPYAPPAVPADLSQ